MVWVETTTSFEVKIEHEMLGKTGLYVPFVRFVFVKTSEKGRRGKCPWAFPPAPKNVVTLHSGFG
jgi:hypothetical protein